MIVVDASVIAPAVGDDGRDGATCRRLLRDRQPLAAPELLDVEVASVLRRRWLAGSLDDARLAAAAEDLGTLPVQRCATRKLVGRALELRANVTAYDGVYVALAEAFSVPLVTADRRLAAATGPRCAIELVVSG